MFFRPDKLIGGPLSLLSLLYILMTIFFYNRALRKPKVAEQTPHTPTNIGSKF